MTERYFEKFPIIEYANTKAVDITERVVFTDRTLKNPYVFYPYDLDVYERPDQFANRYYGDSYYAWLLYISNNIFDPYYDWYIPTEDFNSLINSKYGKFENAVNKVKFFRNNWADSEPITKELYNALPGNLQKYWQSTYAVEGNYDELNMNYLTYTRKRDDIMVTTNNIRSYIISNSFVNSTSSNAFIHDEICHIYFNGTHTGNGQVTYVSNNKTELYLQHTFGKTLPSNSTIMNNCFIYGTESGVNTTFTSASSVVDNLAEEEMIYFTPVTYYDYENEKNEENKSILVLDSPYAARIAKNLKDLLK